MQICLTDQVNKLEFTIEAALILTCKRDPQNPLITHVVTNIMSQKGLQAYAVLETPSEVARRINAALGCTVAPDILGFTAH